MKTLILVCLCMLVAAAVETTGALQTAGATVRLTSSEKSVLALVNHARTSRGLHSLRVRGALEKAARSHSRDMVARDYFSHNSASGAAFSSRLRAFGYSPSGCSSWCVGEIIGYSSSSRAARSVFRAWMESPGHRSVILTRSFRDVGVGAAKGTFCGMSGVSMFTVDFGHRVR
ncbi:MAG TPA: CAP domain-containing protein [Thermoleophilia bacterium]|nr:CAP domain-containing protein [Thermoleophilia bacterium]